MGRSSFIVVQVSDLLASRCEQPGRSVPRAKHTTVAVTNVVCASVHFGPGTGRPEVPPLNYGQTQVPAP